MYVRLAFAVAAHLNPEILIVDEVLAVGDQAFQKKCLGKMQDVAKAGRTVIVVSHNMTTITRLCTSAILMANGALIAKGRSDLIASQYLIGQSQSMAAKEWPDPAAAPGSEVARMRSIRVCDERGETCESVQITRPVRIRMEYDVLEAGHVLVPNFHVLNDEGVLLFCTRDNEGRWLSRPKQCGRYVSTVTIPGNFLSEGGHTVTGVMSTYGPNRNHWIETEIVGFQVVDSLESRGVRLDYGGQWPGVVRPWFEWESEFMDERLLTPATSANAEHLNTLTP
jgi:lipopolysaccharide transport system ATP-binding protein